jgi:uncharacterized protein
MGRQSFCRPIFNGAAGWPRADFVIGITKQCVRASFLCSGIFPGLSHRRNGFRSTFTKTTQPMESNGIMALLSQPWHWAVGGFAIALLSILMTLMGRSFGVSTAFKVLCAYAGAGKKTDYFRINLKDESWRILFVAGGIIGGYIAVHWLRSPEPVAISPSTVDYLAGLGMAYPGADESGLGFVPTVLYSFANWKGLILAIVGGFLVGFGARYGEGCTSGHAITGLAHLQLPSLVTVIGFFIGGLFMTWLVLPYILPYFL